uniref:Gentisate 1,2-dioxygenase n=1 Tax=Xanthobacter polyaromaticivorans TaxID=225625 RepID=A0A2R4QMZ9_9HYPH|nr:gentisate 1,2-dioxygenase [Xanthobacter polyaromaticivorans]
MSFAKAPMDTAERQNFYKKIDDQSYTALWTVLNNIITPEPRSNWLAHVWRFTRQKDHLLEVGGLITAKRPKRRVLVLENPGLRGQSRITTSLYAGLQIVMPDEVAPAHRHSQCALRLVLDGNGAHTSVDGERTIMSFGDFIITPPWTWHDHGNSTDEPMIWLDGLDIAVVSLFDASFAEEYGADEQPIVHNIGDSSARYGANLMPVDFVHKGLASPIFNYPYERSREALEALKKSQEWDRCHGLKMRFVNPVDGGWAMPTIATGLQLLPKGFSAAPYRSTDAMVFVVLEGSGKSQIGGKEIIWGKKDVFVAPSWHWVTHMPLEETVFFTYSDRVAQEKLGLWREDRGNQE